MKGLFLLVCCVGVLLSIPVISSVPQLMDFFLEQNPNGVFAPDDPLFGNFEIFEFVEV